MTRAKPSVEMDMLAKDSVGTDAVDDKGDLSFSSQAAQSKFSLYFSILLYIFLQEIAIVEDP